MTAQQRDWIEALLRSDQIGPPVATHLEMLFKFFHHLWQKRRHRVPEHLTVHLKIVRHYVLMQADYPVPRNVGYVNLKRALKAEIDEDAWSALYSTRSLPFEQPENGQVAVKVINHYGDEVLKVYEV